MKIVDTPGINDPVPSREERTRERLKYCDVIFIISPSGQFLSSEDTSLLDRITRKEGVREFFVIASQIDLQLMGPEIKERAKRDLKKALDDVTATLEGHLKETFAQLGEKNPEIKSLLDQLIRGKLLHSSGLCQSLKLLFDQRERWDDGMETLWKNLSDNYPDSFSIDDKNLSSANLDLLANTSVIEKELKEVRKRKEGILKERREEYAGKKRKLLTDYLDGLTRYIEEQKERIEKADIKKIEKQKADLMAIQEKASSSTEEDYFDLVEDLASRIKNTLKGHFKGFLQRCPRGSKFGGEKRDRNVYG